MSRYKPLPVLPVLNDAECKTRISHIKLQQDSWMAVPGRFSEPGCNSERLSALCPNTKPTGNILSTRPSSATTAQTEGTLSPLPPSVYNRAAKRMKLTTIERIRILESLPSLDILFDISACGPFEVEFSSNPLHFIKTTLKRSDPEQWELREMGVSHAESGNPLEPGSDIYLQKLVLPCSDSVVTWTPTTYLDHYAYEMFVCAQITGFILSGCREKLHLVDQDLTALGKCTTGRGEELHRALWRIWTFCRIFGFNKQREDDLIAQQQWLAGGPMRQDLDFTVCPGAFQSELLDLPPASFGLGNRGGLSPAATSDMISLWKCLHTLFIKHLREGPSLRDGPLDLGNIGKLIDHIAEHTY